ncbi:MAG TPA: wax ester/triacylglycerol synthase family O-acyltransferase [Solirubrobacteraceae bacterium]|jgi:WS/DGAT/MGAT family acyltransferase|nr:wax ester/triacylglycerol synthase family O-acyltransferase [Solirubrobacteraceae bacterium]
MSHSRLTTLDASFLEVESPCAHMHVGWAALFRPPPERATPTFEELRDHIASRLGRAPRYRQKLAHVPLDINDPVWVDDGEFDVCRHVRRAPSPDFNASIDQVMSTQLDRDRPLWETWVSDELADGRIGVVGKAHHAMVDGLAAVELASLMLDPGPETPAPAPDGWRPASGPGSAKLVLDGLVDRAGEAVDAARWSLELIRRPQGLLDLPGEWLRGAQALLDALRPADANTGLNEPISSRRHLARVHRPLSDLKRVRSRFGTTINDVLLAVAAGGVRQFLQRRGGNPVPLKTMVPVSVRSNNGGGEFGNQISFVFVDLPCDEPDPVRRLMTIHEDVDERKRDGEPEIADRVLKAFAYAPRTVRKVLSRVIASPRTFNLVVSNIPGPPEPMYMLGCELEEAYPVVPLADGHGVSIGLTTIGDQAFFGIYADRRSLPDADLLAGCLERSIDELVELSDRESLHLVPALNGGS